AATPEPAPARARASEAGTSRPPRKRRRRFRRGGGKGAGPRAHADRWLEAWNAHDLDEIVACYAEDVDYAVPAAAAGREDRRLSSREELREHFARGLELAPNLAFDEESLLIGPAGYALLYRREDGHRAIEAVELDESGLVARARVYYEREQS
ncbi:MAG TPA: nuclear transport factor 2 family protein, partial [Solirubrobacterales bacterium]|nr:nuclear transport factor 2 family protein [Solirubrobacterales bacterium]